MLAYNPGACACCLCFTGGLEVQRRGDTYPCREFSFGELAHVSGIFRQFRTHASSGVGLYAVGGGGPMHWAIANAHCTYTGRNEVGGGSQWQEWQPANVGDGYGAAWDDRALAIQGLPESVDNECGDSSSYFDFATEIVNTRRARAAYFDGYPAFVPRGDSLLINEVHDGDWYDFGRAALGDWGETTAGTFDSVAARVVMPTEDSATFTFSQQRHRWYFRPPVSGLNIRFSWQIIWTPAGEDAEPELYDEVSWQWDKSGAEDFDLEDTDTWPRTDWFEMPIPTEPGVYSVANLSIKCGRSLAPEPPGEMEAL